ncbi:uncharacterized protein LOC135224770 [Macrobrachium nipponense]|uniref:uncharacterized protein LOC135224770 n=1 Tax=Macrobrachium nipponense TaxID=159736 RepID=UPI0030C8648C
MTEDKRKERRFEVTEDNKRKKNIRSELVTDTRRRRRRRRRGVGGKEDRRGHSSPVRKQLRVLIAVEEAQLLFDRSAIIIQLNLYLREHVLQGLPLIKQLRPRGLQHIKEKELVYHPNVLSLLEASPIFMSDPTTEQSGNGGRESDNFIMEIILRFEEVFYHFYYYRNDDDDDDDDDDWVDEVEKAKEHNGDVDWLSRDGEYDEGHDDDDYDDFTIDGDAMVEDTGSIFKSSSKDGNDDARKGDDDDDDDDDDSVSGDVQHPPSPVIKPP